jgi:uncharacterized repeat protein (TIGR03803 family)
MKTSRLLVCASLTLAAALSFSAAHAAYTEKILYTLMGSSDGGNPTGLLTADSKGNLYGVAGVGGNTSCKTGMENTDGCGVVFELAPTTGDEVVLHTFNFTGVSGSDGASPVGGVIRDAAGTLFGATAQGGAVEAHCNHGCGTVFSLTSSGTLTLLHSFTGGSDGQGPAAGLLRDTKGNLYGMTLTGGSSATCGDKDTPGCGTVFKVTSAGKESVLHVFGGGSDDGAYPIGSLVEDSAGNLYGTTVAGGSTGSCGILKRQGCGIVFELAANGTLSILHAFTGGSDGAYPTGALMFDSQGNLYGTTVGGGSDANCGVGPYGCGTVFKLPVAGGESVLYAFQGGTDGGYPTSGVIADSDDNLYGVTAAGGGTGNCGFKFKPIKGCGTAFEIAAAGGESILHVFTGKKGAGGYPIFGLIRNKAGKFFGATTSGGVIGCSGGAGPLNCGTVFDMTLKK